MNKFNQIVLITSLSLATYYNMPNNTLISNIVNNFIVKYYNSNYLYRLKGCFNITGLTIQPSIPSFHWTFGTAFLRMFAAA